MHSHKWTYTSYVTMPNNDQGADTILGFVCHCGAMKKVVGFDLVEEVVEKKRMGRPPKVNT